MLFLCFYILQQLGKELFGIDAELGRRSPRAHSQRIAFFFLVAYNQQVWNLAKLAVSNLVLYGVVPRIELAAYPVLQELLMNFLSRINIPVGQRQYLHLHRGQPQRQIPFAVFQQYADEPLERAVYYAVYDHRSALFAAAVDILQVEFFGDLEIKLDGAHLPFPAERIVHQYVNLRAVEGPVLFGDKILATAHFCVKDFPERRLRLVPGLYVAHERIGPGAEAELVRHPKYTVEQLDYLQYPFILILYLVFRDEIMRIVLPESAHPEQTGKSPGQLVAVKHIGVRKPQRQILVASRLGAEDYHRVRAVHCLNAINLVVPHVCDEHVLLVMVPVS